MLETSRQPEEVALREAMDRYVHGDFSAFEVLYDGLAPRLRAMLRRQGGDAALTDDIVQQTFLRMHCARAHYQRGHEVLPWVYAIARRLLIDAWWCQQRENRRPERMSEPAIGGPEDELIAGETAARIERGLDALPPLHREAFNLVKLDGLSHKQTAQVLGTSVTAIKLRMHRAYRSLRSAAQACK